MLSLALATKFLRIRRSFPRPISEGSPFKRYYGRSLLRVIEIASHYREAEIVAHAQINYCAAFSSSRALRTFVRHTITHRAGDSLIATFTVNAERILVNAQVRLSLRSIIYLLRSMAQTNELPREEQAYVLDIAEELQKLIECEFADPREYRPFEIRLPSWASHINDFKLSSEMGLTIN